FFSRPSRREHHREGRGIALRPLRTGRGIFHKIPCVLARPKQFLHAMPQYGVPDTSFIQIGFPLSNGQSPSGAKNSQLALEVLSNGVNRIFYHTMQNTKSKGATNSRAQSAPSAADLHSAKHNWAVAETTKQIPSPPNTKLRQCRLGGLAWRMPEKNRPC